MASKVANAVLEYGSSGTGLIDGRFRRIAFFCAVVPLSVGVLTTIMWALTEWQVWQLVGIITFLTGVLAFFVGIVCVWMFYRANRHLSRELRNRVFLQTVFTSILLSANFPLAFVCAMVADNYHPLIKY